MPRPIVTMPLVLLLTACGGLKTVDAEALAEVDAAAMEPILEEQQDLSLAESDLETLLERRSELRRLVRNARSDAERAEVDVSDTRETKVTAVRAGDTSSVEELDATIAAAESVYEAKQAHADRLEQELAVLEKKIEAGEIRVELARAEVELARVKAAQASGAEVEPAPFLRQVDELSQAYAQALREVDEVRTASDA